MEAEIVALSLKQKQQRLAKTNKGNKGGQKQGQNSN